MANETREKFLTAIRVLSSGTGTLKVRLRLALVPDLLVLRQDQMPWPDLWDRFLTLREEVAPNGRRDVALDQWWDFELGRIAQEVVDIFDEITRRQGA